MVLVLGDTHGRDNWKQAIDKHTPDKVVFLGDYFDSFDIPSGKQLLNFTEIVEYKKTAEIPVVLLIGNHDHHYIKPSDGGIGTERYSGYQYAAAGKIKAELEEHREHLCVAHLDNGFLFTHSGVSPIWLSKNLPGYDMKIIDEQLNELYATDSRRFDFNDSTVNPYGDDVRQGPLWIRPMSLFNSNKGRDRVPYNQMVGHTQVKSIMDTVNNPKMSGFFLVDAMEDGGYVTIEDGVVIPHVL